MTDSKEAQRILRGQISRAKEVPDLFFECRAGIKHALYEVQPFVKPQHGEAECFHCSSCGAFRIDIISPRWGELLSRRYILPDGYHVTRPDNGDRTFSAAAFRVARLNRRKEGGRKLPSVVPATVDLETE